MTKAQLDAALTTALDTEDEDLIEAIYDELDRRDDPSYPEDYSESDRAAAQQDRFDMLRNEY